MEVKKLDKNPTVRIIDQNARGLFNDIEKNYYNLNAAITMEINFAHGCYSGDLIRMIYHAKLRRYEFVLEDLNGFFIKVFLTNMNVLTWDCKNDATLFTYKVNVVN